MGTSKKNTDASAGIPAVACLYKQPDLNPME